MKKLEKKQIPQFAALCVLSAGTFGYFVMKMVTPSPAAAGTRPHPVMGTASTATASSPLSTGPAGAGKAGENKGEAAKVAAGPDAAPAEAEAPAPTPGMRDPFVIGYVDLKSPPVTTTSPALPIALVKPLVSLKKPAEKTGPQVASIHEVGPAPVGLSALPFGLKGLPSLGAAPALPVAPKKVEPEAPAAPAWTVTGVLENGAGQIAILRSGEARRIVHAGDFVDSVYRVVAVTRSAVILRHGKTIYHLTLGTAKTAAPAVSLPTTRIRSMFPPVPISVPAPVPPPQDAALAPADDSAGLGTKLAQVIQAALLLAQSYMVPAQAEVDACLASFRDRQALPPQAAMQVPDGPALRPGSTDARARLDLGRDLYQSGNRAAARAQWRCVLAMDDLPAADEAVKLLDRYN